MYATTPPLLPIAQVHAPHGAIWYIAHARSHHGFVVQRRYLRASKALGGYEGYYQASMVPFLSPEAVQAAGLAMQDILQWSAEHPNEIFAHPQYAALCLRWGENAHGFQIGELPLSPATEQQVPFTPHTCWQSGITYYQLAMPGAVEQTEPLLVARLRDLAGLEKHEWEIGEEGSWQGWYATDRAALEQILASLGHTLHLAQTNWHYGVWVQLKPGDDQRQLVAAYTSLEEAWSHFCSLPKPPNELRCEFPRVTFGCEVDWPDQEVDWDIITSMYVERGFAMQMLAEKARWTGRVMPVAYCNSINAVEHSTLGEVPFLAEILAVSKLSRPQQAAALGWTMIELQKREKNPALLTPDSLRQVARLTGLPVSDLAAQQSHYLKMREASRQQMLAYYASIDLDL